MEILNKKIILASQSPRRKELMEKAGFSNINIMPAHINESYPAGLPFEQVPVYLAEQKAESLKYKINDEILIAADTVVILNNEILNKPEDEADAFNILTKLSGNMHRVITGVCMLSNNNKTCFSDTTNVYFKILTAQEINFYINRYKPFDKAGAYGVQEFIGLIGIEKIEGSFYNVMGLPVKLVYQNLLKF